MKFAVYIILIFLITACEIKPVSINYGTDVCHYCSMSIVDRGHASQFITEKGKPFKFDSIECLYRELEEKGSQSDLMIVVADLANPGNLINVEDAYFLISEEIPSPMGANLSAFSDSLSVLEYGGDGKVYRWKNLVID